MVDDAPGECWQRQLAAGLEAMRLQLEQAQRQTLLDYLALLAKWNRAYNLTAVRNPAEAVSRQLLDSLVVLPLLTGSRILDLGSGAGLPGIPLAIARPDIRVTLLDANRKKCRFMEQAKLELAIPNIEVVCVRVEHYRPEAGFELILSRAFASLPDMVAQASRLLVPDGAMLALKGKLPRAEISQLEQRGMGLQIHRLRVPGTDGERHAIRLLPQN